MRRNAVLAVIVAMMMTLWMTGLAHAAQSDTCEGYENKEEVPASGSGTTTVTADGSEIGSITWNNDADPESVSWEVEDGYSLDVCVKGGDGLATGSGQSGTVTPPENDGGETPDVSHYAWTVSPVAASGPTETNGDGGENGDGSQDGDGGDNQTTAPTESPTDDTDVAASDDDVAQTDDDGDGEEVAQTDDDRNGGEEVAQTDDDRDGEEVAQTDAGGDDETTQVAQVPEGAASTGGGSTSGVEHAPLVAVGLALIAAAGSLLVFARTAARRA